MSKRELKALTVANRDLLLGEEGRLWSEFVRTEKTTRFLLQSSLKIVDPGRQAEVRDQPGVGTHQPEVGDQQLEASAPLNVEVQILHWELIHMCKLLNDKEVELATVKRTLTSAKVGAKTVWSEVKEVCYRLAGRETEFHTFILKAELEKLREIEVLRKEFDEECSQLSED